MLTIELRRPKEGVCPDCEGTGLRLPQMRKLLTEAGVFCDCAVGRERWEATQHIAASVEAELAAAPSFSQRIGSKPPGNR